MARRATRPTKPARPRSADAALDALSAAARAARSGDAGAAESVAAAVRAGLATGVEVVVLRAAGVAAEAASLDPPAVAGDLSDAARDALGDGRYEAETVAALLAACRACGVADRELYRAGLWFERVTTDPVSGRRFDAGADVRAEACLGVAGGGPAGPGDPSAALLLAGVLGESSGPGVVDNPAARAAAARALGEVGGADAAGAAGALRVRLTRSGESDPAVLGECCAAYARLDPPGATDFLCAYVASRPDVAACAAVGLAEARGSDAGPLLACHDALRRDGREAEAFAALALARRPEATARLLDRLRDAPGSAAVEAAGALHLLRHDPSVAESVARAADGRPDGASIRSAFARGAGTQVARRP